LTIVGATSAPDSLFVRLISHQPTVLFSQNKPVTSNQQTVLFSHNKSAPAISYQPNEHTVNYPDSELSSVWNLMMNRLSKEKARRRSIYMPCSHPTFNTRG
jgi:hypothetical protein